MRLIDADALPITPVDITDLPKDGTALIVYSKENVDNAPTVDAVEVVRCKDCRWGREVCGNIECSVDLNLPPEQAATVLTNLAT